MSARTARSNGSTAKDIGLSADDAPDALIADLPDIYIYNVDVVGEGLVARRRGMAILVDHMVPPFTKGGLYPERSLLSETISDYGKRRSDNPELTRPMRSEFGSSSSSSESPRISAWRSTNPTV